MNGDEFLPPEFVFRTETDVLLLHGQKRDVDVDEVLLNQTGVVEAALLFVEGALLDEPLKVTDRQVLPFDLAGQPRVVNHFGDLVASRVAQKNENGSAIVHPGMGETVFQSFGFEFFIKMLPVDSVKIVEIGPDAVQHSGRHFIHLVKDEKRLRTPRDVAFDP